MVLYIEVDVFMYPNYTYVGCNQSLSTVQEWGLTIDDVHSQKMTMTIICLYFWSHENTPLHDDKCKIPCLCIITTIMLSEIFNEDILCLHVSLQVSCLPNLTVILIVSLPDLHCVCNLQSIMTAMMIWNISDFIINH